MSLFALAFLFVPLVSIWVLAVRDSFLRRAGLAKRISIASTALDFLCTAF